MLPHIDAAFNLPGWLVSNRIDAEDVAQGACSYRYFRGFPRETCVRLAFEDVSVEFDEESHGETVATTESITVASNERERLICVLEALPVPYREVICSRA